MIRIRPNPYSPRTKLAAIEICSFSPGDLNQEAEIEQIGGPVEVRMRGSLLSSARCRSSSHSVANLPATRSPISRHRFSRGEQSHDLWIGGVWCTAVQHKSSNNWIAHSNSASGDDQLSNSKTRARQSLRSGGCGMLQCHSFGRCIVELDQSIEAWTDKERMCTRSSLSAAAARD